MTNDDLELYTLESMDVLNQALYHIGARQFKKFIKSEKYYAFVTESGKFYIFSIDSSRITEYTDPDAPKSQITCFDISYDQQFLVIGYKDGSLSYWSIPDVKLLSKFENSPIHKSQITALAFGYQSKDQPSIFAGDIKGRVSINIVKNGLFKLSINQTLLTTTSSPILNIKTTKQSIPQLGFLSSANNLFAFNQDTAKKDTKSFIIQKQPIDQCFDMIEKDGKTYTATGNKNTLTLTQWTSPNDIKAAGQQGNICWQISLDNPNENFIFITFFASAVICCLTSEGNILLYSPSHDRIASGKFNEYQSFSSGDATIVSSGDDLLVINSKIAAKLIFTDWKTTVRHYANLEPFDQDNFIQAFKVLVDIHIGNSGTSIGLSPNKTKRRLEVASLGKEIASKYVDAILKLPDLPGNLAFLMAYINTLNISKEVITNIMPRFKSEGKMKEFFHGVFYQSRSANTNNTGDFLTAEFAKEYFDFAKNQGILQQAEDNIASLHLDQSQAKNLLQLAREHQMLALQKRILIVFYHNYILPAQLYYTHNRLSEYCNEIFNKKSEIPKNIIAIWLMTPIEQEYKRLYTLLHENPELSLTFVNQLLKLCPINYTSTEHIEEEQVIDAILRVIEKDNYTDCIPIFNTVLPLIHKGQYRITGACFKNILEWIVTETREHQVREDLLMRTIDQFPNVLQPKYVQQLCSLCGFVQPALKYFLPEQNYSKIIETYINSDKSNEVFDFIDQYISDDKMTHAITEHISALLRIDNERIVRIITDETKIKEKGLFEKIKNSLSGNDLVNLLFGSYSCNKDTNKLDNTFLLQLFEAMCMNARHSSNSKTKTMPIDFLKSIINKPQFPKDKALDIARNYGAIDCYVQILINMGKINEAVTLINSEIENSLLELCKSDFNEVIDGVDHIESCHSEQLKRAYTTIQTTITLLKQLSINDLAEEVSKGKEQNSIGTNHYPAKTMEKWLNAFLAFQFPFFFLSQQYKGDEEDKANLSQEKLEKHRICKERTSTALSYLFIHFVISSLNYVDSFRVYACIAIYFRFMDPKQYRQVISTLFNRLDYQVMLNSCVEDILVDDCVNECNKAFAKSNAGYQIIDDPVCAVCHQPLKNTLDEFKVFSCGHCLHNKCGHHTQCPICAQQNIIYNEQSGDSTIRANSKLALSRFKYALNINYDSQQYDEEYHSYVKIQGDPLVYDDGTLKPIDFTITDIPPYSDYVFDAICD